MNKLLDELQKEYKPYRLTKKKNVTIIDSTSGSYVIKSKENDKVYSAYNYLKSRNFDYFPKLETELRDSVNVFEYIEEVDMPREQKALDLINLVALLHNKTTYYKEVTEDKYKEIYENLKNNIEFSKNYYNNLYNILIEKVYPSPSEYLVLRNIYKVFAALEFGEDELDNWYDFVKTETKTRVAFIHNNLETDHFIKNDKDYLLSWEKSKIDSPILDLITFYQKEYMNLDFDPIFKKYFQNYPLTKNEKQLLFIVLSIPPVIKLESTELKCTKNISKKLNYVFKTEKLIETFYINSEDK